MDVENVKPGARVRNHGQVAEMAAYRQHSDMLPNRGWMVCASWVLWPVAVVITLAGVLLTWAAVASDSFDRHIAHSDLGVPFGIPLTGWLLLLLMLALLPPFFWSVDWCDRRSRK